MVPMFDPMMPEVTLLFAISPAFAGVVMALVGAAALAIAGALRELRPRAAAPSPAAATARRESRRLAA
jgi:hypothetical protein